MGPWVSGDDFFDREVETAHLEGLLREGCHVSLAAQRRTGKTSLLHAVADKLAPELTCLYVDLQNCRDASDAVVAIALATQPHQRLWTRARDAFANVLGAVQELGLDEITLKLREGALGDWSAKGDRIVSDLAAADPPVVLMLDELPVLLVKLLRDEPAEAERLLSWLRRACQAHNGRLRLVVTGSIGLHPVAHRAGLSGTLNHYTQMALEPWSPSTASACLEALARHHDLEWGEDAADEVVAKLGTCIPYHVQLFFQLIEDDAKRRRRRRVHVADVQRVYANRMLSSYGHADLAHMEERLRLMVEPHHHALVLDLLTEAAVVGRLEAVAALALAGDAGIEAQKAGAVLRDLLGVLEHDGYLERVEGSHRFASRLLRDWWSARFRDFYVPVERR